MDSILPAAYYFEMNSDELEGLLRSFKSGELSAEETARRLKNLHYEDIGYARYLMPVPHDRVFLKSSSVRKDSRTDRGNRRASGPAFAQRDCHAY